MSEEQLHDQEGEAAEQEIEASDEVEAGEEEAGEEFEEISSDEVDRVVSVLEGLAESTKSENIKAHLDEAVNNIYYLVYDESDEEDEEDEVNLLEDAA
jgi:DNA-binding transcriptional regulator GbsR (MarR family)